MGGVMEEKNGGMSNKVEDLIVPPSSEVSMEGWMACHYSLCPSLTPLFISPSLLECRRSNYMEIVGRAATSTRYHWLSHPLGLRFFFIWMSRWWKMPDCNLTPKTLEGEGGEVDSCAPGLYFVNEKENDEKLSKHGIIRRLNRHEI